MSKAISFALLSMLFTGVIDVLYRVYAREARSRGLFLCVMGLTWGTLQLGLWLASSVPVTFSTVGWTYGIAAGLFVTASNLALIEAMTHVPISLGSTVYRLNTIGVVVLAWLFLGETAGVVKLAGIFCGIGAVLLLYQPTHELPGDRTFPVFVGIAVLASLLRASYGVTSKAGLTAGASPQELMLISAACWVVGGLGYAALRERRVVTSAASLRIGIVAGLVAFTIVNTLIAALTYGEASVVVPISNLGFLTALAISLLAGWEKLSSRKTFAIALAVLAIVLLAREG